MLRVVGGQRHAPTALPPGKTRHPCAEGWVGHRVGLDGYGKSRPPPPGFDPRTVQPVASRYTDWAIPAANNNNNNNNVTIPNSNYLHREAPEVYGLDRRACKNMATKHILCNTSRKGKVHPRTEQEDPEGE